MLFFFVTLPLPVSKRAGSGDLSESARRSSSFESTFCRTSFFKSGALGLLELHNQIVRRHVRRLAADHEGTVLQLTVGTTAVQSVGTEGPVDLAGSSWSTSS